MAMSKQLRNQHVLTCVVCGSEAHSRNFGAVTCEACKSFFRRNAHHQATILECPSGGKCKPLGSTRKFCRYCRLQKCAAVGMSMYAASDKSPDKPDLGHTRAITRLTQRSIDWGLSYDIDYQETVQSVSQLLDCMLKPLEKRLFIVPGSPKGGRGGLVYPRALAQSYIASIEQLVDFAGLSKPMRLALLRSTMAQQSIYTGVFCISDEATGWTVHVEGDSPRQIQFSEGQARYAGLGLVDEYNSSMNFFRHVTVLIRKEFPNDWRFILAFIILITQFSTGQMMMSYRSDPSGDCDDYLHLLPDEVYRVGQLRKKYETVLRAYITATYRSEAATRSETCTRLVMSVAPAARKYAQFIMHAAFKTGTVHNVDSLIAKLHQNSPAFSPDEKQDGTDDQVAAYLAPCLSEL